MWFCIWEPGQIRIYAGVNEKGVYKLIKKPFCDICSRPDVTTEECMWHFDYYGFDKLYAMGAYDPAIEFGENLLKDHILGLKKYKNYSYPLGESLAICVKNIWNELLDSDMIVPVPEVEVDLKVDRESREKYDPAIALGEIFSNNLNIPLIHALEKVRSQSLQGLDREERLEAVKGLFKIKDFNLRDKKIILIDDVATSLSTACECSEILKEGEAKEVNVVVAGRVVRED